MRTIFPWAISHTTIHNLSGKVADSHIEQEEEEIKALYDDGVLHESEGKTVPYLFLEADGINISLQREKETKAEIKAGIAYQGREEVGNSRHKLKGEVRCTLASWVVGDSGKVFLSAWLRNTIFPG